METEHPVELRETFNELSQLLLDEETVETTLQRVGRLAVYSIEGCDVVGVSLAEEGKVLTKVSTDELALQLDTVQYETDDGPCLDSLRRGATNVIRDIRQENRWPLFVDKAATVGLASSASLPLKVRDTTIGALNCYSMSIDSFGEREVRIASLFATQAAIALANARVYAATRELTEHLSEALETREMIGQAIGILMEQQRVDDREAFDILKKASQHSNVKLRNIASQVVELARRNAET